MLFTQLQVAYVVGEKLSELRNLSLNEIIQVVRDDTTSTFTIDHTKAYRARTHVSCVGLQATPSAIPSGLYFVYNSLLGFHFVVIQLDLFPTHR